MRDSAVLPDARREAILSALARDGRVVATELAGTLGVSDDTVRRDLDELAATGRVRRGRGGALPAPAATPPRMGERPEHPTPQKAAGAALAASLLLDEAGGSPAGGATGPAGAPRPGGGRGG